MSNHNIRLKDLSKLGYTDDRSRSIAIGILNKQSRHIARELLIQTLTAIHQQPQQWLQDEVWHKLAATLLPEEEEHNYIAYELRSEQTAAPVKAFGSKHIEPAAKQQMQTCLRLPVAIQGALMPDAHAGYGLPVGAVLAVENALIPYGVGVDIGCRMALTLYDTGRNFLQRNTYQLKMALQDYTHFGMEGGLPFSQEHEVLDRKEFSYTALLKSLHGKAVRQLGTSGSGNHFVEFGNMLLYADNLLGLPEGNYLAILSHSGSRGLGASIAQHYTQLAMEQCRLPREARQLAWLDMNTEAGQEYWLSMNLAGDYAKACHDRIHLNLAKVLGLKPVAKVENHHNFAWKESLPDGRTAYVHRKGATPAHTGEAGIIPGNMIDGGFLVTGKGNSTSLQSAAHGAGRAMSRKKAKEKFTQSSLKKLLSAAGVTLIGGSVEESPMAYKDIQTVMNAQEELITIHGHFTPRIVRMNKE
ncbi:RtcB family protein [Chitinophaga pendula]|uniref:RtcB family protein n=1 Tax=Chitinophaga TaxID=79328 RepID=UPI000BAF56D4|nr:MULTISPECIES: RtcB family protein [Chitinophaga]ASZ10361.1 RNA-splicing ligase RtcB [Chitinophaga sp. MD30]UCJ06674.1 RtcB family protein [Chitinophaga pendula]